ncbi:TIR domain-containing protein [Clostridium tyrobutyricum]|uniref:TIR domain-containing protein n=1 Tax=Clostridium tyrobutyricum TaxID=1519 RepID=UPI001C387312|nr:TIR domain-containing protein [Clostridium tyrobutyricum]MBV4429546.1 nucleotide-binding protein [Clostridium tyrobutyricum]MBV4444767.1 nucleotide-binding protein [Clostridium tyrobutyricum]
MEKNIKDLLLELGENNALNLKILFPHKTWNTILKDKSVDSLVNYMSQYKISKVYYDDWWLTVDGYFHNNKIKDNITDNIKYLKNKGDVFKQKNRIINPFFKIDDKKRKIGNIVENNTRYNDYSNLEPLMEEEIKIFIGSSGETLDLAKLLRDSLSEYLKRSNIPSQVHTWKDVSYGDMLNSTTLDLLIECFKDYDYGVFLFMADDITNSRKEEEYSVRDNVLFEYGLFLGIKGIKKCCMVYSDDIKIKSISDLEGRIQVRIEELSKLTKKINGNYIPSDVRSLNAKIDKAARVIKDSLVNNQY